MKPGRQIEEWFYQYEQAITNYLVYYTGSTDVEDLVQETFLRALQAFRKYRNDANPKTWLIAIARNTAIDLYRNKNVLNKAISRLGNIQIPVAASHAETSLLKKEEYALLYRAINQLKPNYRDVVLLRGIAELSAIEAGEILSWSPNKVNVTFHRAVQKLNALLKEEERRGESIG